MKYLSSAQKNAPLRKYGLHRLSTHAAIAICLALTGVVDCFAQTSDLAGMADIGTDKLSELESVMARGKIPVGAMHPCDAFSTIQLIAVFGEEADAATVERAHVQNDATCTYKWADPDVNIADRDAQVQAALMDAMLGGGKDSSAKMSKLISLASQGEFELSIRFNHAEDFKTDADAIAALDLMVSRLTQGVDDSNFSYSASFEPSEAVGSKAVWSQKLRQVTVASGTYLYHVRLKRNPDSADDREEAEAIARIVAEAL